MGRNNNNFFNRLFRGWSSLEITLPVVILLLCVGVGVFALVAGGIFLVGEVEQVGEATEEVAPAASLEPVEPGEVVDIGGADLDTSGAGPSIVLNPTIGSPGSSVTVQGQGWPAGGKVIIFLVPLEPPNYAISSAIVEGDGRFSVEIIVPSDPRWLSQSPVPILAQLDDESQSAQAFLNIANVPVVQAPPPPTPAPVAPMATPAPGVVITDWRGEYYNNPDLAGAPTLVRNDVAVSFDWGLGSPDPLIPVDNFSSLDPD